MMKNNKRLTISENAFKEKNLEIGNVYANQDFINSMYLKLSQLEDIEDELGIDLITFVKATTQPVLYIKNIPFSNEIKLAILTFIHKNDINDNKDYLVWFEVNREERYLFKLKDYGKTWALTKEELE